MELAQGTYMQWYIESDTFKFHIIMKTDKILSPPSDPFRFAAPFTLKREEITPRPLQRRKAQLGL